MTAALSPTTPVALVTGSSGGIGAAIVARLAKEGYLVAGFDAVAPAADAPAIPIRATAMTRTLDVASAADVRRCVGEVAAELGRIDVLVNCAGTGRRTSFQHTTVDEFMDDIRSNLLGTFLMCQAVVFPHMKGAGGGRIVTVASISGKTGGTGPASPDGSAGRSGPGYASAKAGAINLTRWIAREAGHQCHRQRRGARTHRDPHDRWPEVRNRRDPTRPDGNARGGGRRRRLALEPRRRLRQRHRRRRRRRTRPQLTRSLRPTMECRPRKAQR